MDDIERHLADCSMDSSSRSMDDADVIILVNQALSDVHHLDLDADMRSPSPPPRNVPITNAPFRRDDPTYEQVRDSGPPLDPEPFPAPRYNHARRANRVLCYNPITRSHFEAHDVLFRTQSQDDDWTMRLIDRVYWRMPNKATIETRMGHLEKCHVLRRMTKADDDSVPGDSSDDDSSSDGGDLVFLLTEEIVAVKVNYCSRMQALTNGGQSIHAGENPIVEICALRLVGVDHPHVLGCTEVLYDGENLSIIMPYCDGGDLHDLVVDCQRQRGDTDYGIPEDEAREWFRQLLKGLQRLQELKLCHRDLSPENLLIRSDLALVIDLGMCLRVPHAPAASNQFDSSGVESGTSCRRLIKPQGTVGKFPYMSPEIYRNLRGFDGYAVDMWTAGTILFFLLTGTKYERPYDPVFNAMTQNLAGLLVHWGLDLSREAVDLISGLITIDPKDRMTLEEAIVQPWLHKST